MITKKSNYLFQQNGAPAHPAKTVHDWFDANMWAWPKGFAPLSHQIWTPSTSACGLVLKKRLARDAISTQMSFPRKVFYEEKFRQEGLQGLPILIRVGCCRQRWPRSIIWYLWVLIYRYVAKVVHFLFKLRFCRRSKFIKQNVAGLLQSPVGLEHNRNMCWTFRFSSNGYINFYVTVYSRNIVLPNGGNYS